MTTPDEPVTLSPSDLFLAPELSEDRASRYLASRGFREPAAADRNLQLMADDLVSRQALGSLAAVLLDCLSVTPDPDAALVGFSRYLATRTPKSSFLRYLHDDPRALQVLTQGPRDIAVPERNPDSQSGVLSLAPAQVGPERA